MEIKIRECTPADLPAAVAAEESAMKGGGYLQDVSPLFLSDREGPLLVAEVEGEIVGVAKYTLQYDHTAWLETLRVRPEFQRKGVGRAFYNRFVELSREKGVPSMAMYTGVKNVASASLARVFGLECAQVYREASLPLEGAVAPKQAAEFQPVSPDRACALLEPLREGWKGFLIFNRTFFHMNQALYRGLAQEGKVFEDRESGSFLAFGNRFLEKRSVQIGILGGDLQKCLDFAKAQGIQKGVPAVTIMFPPENQELQALLEKNGYVCAPSDLMVMEGAVKKRSLEISEDR